MWPLLALDGGRGVLGGTEDGVELLGHANESRPFKYFHHRKRQLETD